MANAEAITIDIFVPISVVANNLSGRFNMLWTASASLSFFSIKCISFINLIEVNAVSLPEKNAAKKIDKII